MLGISNSQISIFDNYLYKNILPEEHILLDIKEQVDFSFVQEELKDLYDANTGRPSCPPEVLLKILFLEFYYNLSDVEVVKQCQYNMLYRYFVGLPISDSIPDDTTLVVFRNRCGRERFERLFDCIVEQCKEKGLLKERLKIVDATAIDADVAIPNKVNLLRQGRRVISDRIIKSCPDKEGELLEYITKERLHQKPSSHELTEEISKTREFVSRIRGKFGPDEDELLDWLEDIYNPDRKQSMVASFIDTDARHGIKTPKRRFSGYKAHICQDESEIITSVDFFEGNRNEGSKLSELLEKEVAQGIGGDAVVADALYDSAINRQGIHDKGMKAYIPCRRQSKQASGFVYNAETDQLCCPQGVYSQDFKSRQSVGWLYNLPVEACRKCSSQCQAFKGNRSRVFISDDYKLKMEDDDDFYFLAIKKRKMIERKFGEAKKWHGLSRARYRGKWRVAIQALMTFMVINVKRMVKLIKNRPKSPTLSGKLAYNIG
jgi:IS5 family transposase